MERDELVGWLLMERKEVSSSDGVQLESFNVLIVFVASDGV